MEQWIEARANESCKLDPKDSLRESKTSTAEHGK